MCLRLLIAPYPGQSDVGHKHVPWNYLAERYIKALSLDTINQSKRHFGGNLPIGWSQRKAESSFPVRILL